MSFTSINTSLWGKHRTGLSAVIRECPSPSAIDRPRCAGDCGDGRNAGNYKGFVQEPGRDIFSQCRMIWRDYETIVYGFFLATGKPAFFIWHADSTDTHEAETGNERKIAH